VKPVMSTLVADVLRIENTTFEGVDAATKPFVGAVDGVITSCAYAVVVATAITIDTAIALRRDGFLT
jgi:hypothetical protein